jgi:glycerophosphoryl diester phosphodiesterase
MQARYLGLGAWLISLVLIAACQEKDDTVTQFDWQGHRGSRGLSPENSIPAMQRALQEGVTTLEMDVVISADSVVLLSHEPYISAEICLNSQGEVLLDQPDSFNIYRMPYDVVATFDCGSKPHPRFPSQEKYRVVKPRLIDVFSAAEEAAVMMNRPEPYYNIEIKSRPEWDGQFHPEVKTYVDLVLAEVERAQLGKRCIIQSFDPRALKYCREKYPHIKLAYLVEDKGENLAGLIEDLGFFPDIFSPEYSLVSRRMVQELHAQKVDIIPWTVNEIAEAEQLIEMGVDGIITDYPARLISALDP